MKPMVVSGLTLTSAVAMFLLVAPSQPSHAQESTGGKASSKDTFSPYVDAKGQIKLPSDYKTKWVHLGDWAVAKKPGQDAHELHEVYTQPGVVEAFQKTGSFPDGAVLVKEVRKTKSAKLTTGHVTWADDMKIWFVMVKDKTNRFPDNPIWGDGWGWALFEAKDPTKNTTTNYDRSCIGCHLPAEKTDWIYLQGYPALKKKN